MLYYLIATVYALACLMLLLVVLLQQGKGGDIASAFGGGGSQTAFGARQGATVLSRATAVLGAVFVLGALALAVWGRQGPGSVVGGIQGPAAIPAAATTPVAPAPGTQPAPAAPGAPAAPTGTTAPPAEGSAAPATPEK
ncbi:MAG: preprotein translocase subunit SecG [Vicinamibacterales bacterium]